jgi:hypothetical protein
MVGKSEWIALKNQWNNRCAICRLTEGEMGTFDKAHLKAGSKNGKLILPLCVRCHRKYDRGQLSDSELKRIGLTRENYVKFLPKKGGGGIKKSEAEKSIEKQKQDVEKAIRGQRLKR